MIEPEIVRASPKANRTNARYSQWFERTCYVSVIGQTASACKA